MHLLETLLKVLIYLLRNVNWISTFKANQHI